MELRQLRYFASVAEAGSFTAAASRLNVAQSALSRQVSNLEAELGVSLFERTGRRAQLSPIGETLRTAVADLLGDVEDLRALARGAGRGMRGRVVLGAHPSDGDVLLPPVIEGVRQLHPGITIDPVQALTVDLQDMLLRRRVDLAVVTFPDPLPGLDFDPIAREQVYLVAPTGSLPFSGSACTVPQALGVPLILAHRPNRERVGIEEMARKAGVELAVSMEADGLSLMKHLSLQGIGALLLPATAVLQERADPRWTVLPVTGFVITRFIARRSNIDPHSPIHAVLKIVEREVGLLKDAGIML